MKNGDIMNIFGIPVVVSDEFKRDMLVNKKTVIKCDDFRRWSGKVEITFEKSADGESFLVKAKTTDNE